MAVHKKQLLLIDNFDSFTYNLVHHFEVLGVKVVMLSPPMMTVEKILSGFDFLVIGPGPGTPMDHPTNIELILLATRKKIPTLGICLGHQAVACAFGGVIQRAHYPLHGKVSEITHDEQSIFKGLPNPIYVGRYHSLVVNKTKIPSCLEISAESKQGEIMAIRHRLFPTFGVQFHPDSFLSTHGHAILNNFIQGEFL